MNLEVLGTANPSTCACFSRPSANSKLQFHPPAASVLKTTTFCTAAPSIIFIAQEETSIQLQVAVRSSTAFVGSTCSFPAGSSTTQKHF
ncbi:hypothetical protein ACFXTH_000912 [Malus domestica]